MPTDDLARFCCHNPDCPQYGRRGAGNLSVCGHFGKAGHRLLYCNACKTRFSELKGTPLFPPSCRTTRSRPSSGTSLTAAASARPPGWSTSTRTPSPGWPNSPVATPGPPTTSWWPSTPSTREVQFDEKWAFAGKKQKVCDPDDLADDHWGDYWDYAASDPEHRLVLAVIPGARAEENGRELVAYAMTRPGITLPCDSVPNHNLLTAARRRSCCLQ
jgi:hypothetical protein